MIHLRFVNIIGLSLWYPPKSTLLQSWYGSLLSFLEAVCTEIWYVSTTSIFSELLNSSWCCNGHGAFEMWVSYDRSFRANNALAFTVLSQASWSAYLAINWLILIIDLNIDRIIFSVLSIQNRIHLFYHSIKLDPLPVLNCFQCLQCCFWKNRC